MSDSDSEHLDGGSRLRGVPILFGRSSQVKRLMDRIRSQGLLCTSDSDQEQNNDTETDNDELAEDTREKGVSSGGFESGPKKSETRKKRRKPSKPRHAKQGSQQKSDVPKVEFSSDDDAGGEKSTPKFKYQCEHCQEGFKGSIPLARHCRQVHRIEKPFSCSLCDKTFARLATLRDHRVVSHTAAAANICDVCGKALTNPSSLKAHARVHSDERPFACDKCPQAFKGASTLRNHIRAVHSNPEDRDFVCDVCGQRFSIRRYLVKHKRYIHVLQNKEQCTECGRMFKLKQNLLEHMETHGRKLYTCPICGKVVTLKRSFKRHMQAHDTTEPFNCPLCNRQYKNQRSAEPHMKLCKEQHSEHSSDKRSSAESQQAEKNKKTSTRQATDTFQVQSGEASRVENDRSRTVFKPRAVCEDLYQHSTDHTDPSEHGAIFPEAQIYWGIDIS